MKKIFSIIIIALSSSILYAQSELKVFTVDGIKVIFRPNNKEVISARLFVKGGTANYVKNEEGIESLLFNLITEGGTKTKSKLVFSATAEKMGTSFGSSTSFDYGEIHLNCIKPFWNESWDLFSDAILNPAFDEEEFSLLQQQLMAGAKQKQSDPDAHLRNIAMQHAFEGRNYAKLPEGSPESLQKINLQQVKDYYKKIIGKNRCFLVVVGNTSQEDITSKIKTSLGKLSFGTTLSIEPRKLITEPGIFVEDRDIATNYIRGMMSAPTMASADGLPMRIAMQILRDRFFVELRTKRSLTYAPQASYAYSIINDPYSVVYASTQKPKEALEVMINEINSIKSQGFSEKEFNDQKSQMLTQYYMALQTADDQTSELGMAEMFGNLDIATQFSTKLNALTLKDVNRAFDKYTNAIRWTYLGKKDQVQTENFKQTKAVEGKYKPY